MAVRYTGRRAKVLDSFSSFPWTLCVQMGLISKAVLTHAVVVTDLAVRQCSCLWVP